MKREEYLEIVKKYTPKEEILKNALISFISGGLVGVFGTFIYDFLLKYNVESPNLWTLLIIIFLSSLFTGLGFMDDLVSTFRCGLIVPITGFAHSVTSSALDYKKDGLITGLGSNFFKLAGSVILYGVISAFILTVIKVVFYV